MEPTEKTEREREREEATGTSDGHSLPASRALAAFRASVLVALSASAALYLQYLNPAQAAFCGLQSGCEVVRRAAYSYFFESPLLSLPLVGLLAYGTVFAASLRTPRGKAPVVLACVGALSALALLSLQAFVVHAFCWLCVAVDVAAVLAALFAFLVGKDAGSDPLRPGAWLLLALLAVLAPVGWVKVKPLPPVPEEIRALYVPGKVNVVEFADFECPYCRKFHATLQGAIEAYPKDQIRFVRKHAPLPSHEQALPAARADVCAEQQGLGEQLAARLVEIEPSPSANRAAAIEVGVDAGKFDRCMASTEPDQRIDADSRLLERAGMLGLPTTYIQGKRLLGAVSDAAVRDAIDRALRGDAETGIPGAIYVPLVLAALALAAWFGRARRVTLVHERPN